LTRLNNEKLSKKYTFYIQENKKLIQSFNELSQIVHKTTFIGLNFL